MPRTISIKALLLSVVLSVLSLPSFAAQLSYSCSYYQPPQNGATRIPRAGGFAHFLTVSDYSAGNLQPNSSISVTLASTGNGCTNPYDGTSYTLVSATISGGLQGTAQAFAPLPSHVPGVAVGGNDIVVTYTYLPNGGGRHCTPPCPPGGAATIDEASDSGGLLDDVFVEVYAPQTASQPDLNLTKSGNYYGTVDTTSQTVKIEADVNPVNGNTNQPTGSLFDRWVSTDPASSFGPGARDVNLERDQSGYFLAYYSSGCPSTYHFETSANLSECVPNNCAATQYWNTSTNTCVTCGPDQYWNPAANECLTATNPCPSTCVFGCIQILRPNSNTPIYVCRKGAGGP
jgi:hypothetical protein